MKHFFGVQRHSTDTLGVKKILLWFTTWRLLLFIPVLLATVFLPFRENSLYTTLWQYTQKYPIVENELISVWSNFDGVHYVAIASKWYTDEGRFLPLFPVVVGLVAMPLSFIWPIVPYGPATFWAGILASSVATILALYFTAKLLQLDYKTKTVTFTLFLLLASPVAFFLACIYSEGLFLLLSVLALYFARQKKWFLASVTAMFLSVTRLSGILIILPLLWEYYELELKNKKILWKNHANILWFALVPVLLILYSYFNYLKWGDFLYFINAHGMLGNSREVSGLVFPLITVYRYLKIFLTVSTTQYEFWIALLEFGALIYAVLSIFLVWKMKIRTSYLVFSVAMVSLPLLSGTLSGFPRYILPIFPFFLAQAIWFKNIKKTKLGKIIFVVFIAVSILLQALLLALFTREYYIS
ncbi:hypothetical protein KA017_00500 [Candidatus Woesebacteria bacterium]|nr:hypothetical protein [Candidatus Woesebacteria bacterium]